MCVARPSLPTSAVSWNVSPISAWLTLSASLAASVSVWCHYICRDSELLICTNIHFFSAALDLLDSIKIHVIVFAPCDGAMYQSPHMFH